jgi:hypothetical protein
MQVLKTLGLMLTGLAAALLMVGMSQAAEQSSADQEITTAKHFLSSVVSAEMVYFTRTGAFGTMNQLTTGSDPVLGTFPESDETGVLFGMAVGSNGQRFSALTVCMATDRIVRADETGCIQEISLDQLALALLEVAEKPAPVPVASGS